MRFLRSQAYIDYFNYLDQAGGFYYERWGDAPVRMPPDLQPGAYSFSMVTIYGAACHDFPEWWERGGVGVDGCLLVLCSMHHVVRMNPAPLKVLTTFRLTASSHAGAHPWHSSAAGPIRSALLRSDWLRASPLRTSATLSGHPEQQQVHDKGGGREGGLANRGIQRFGLQRQWHLLEAMDAAMARARGGGGA